MALPSKPHEQYLPPPPAAVSGFLARDDVKPRGLVDRDLLLRIAMRNSGSIRRFFLVAIVIGSGFGSVPLARARVCAGPTRLVGLAGNLQADVPLLAGGFDGESIEAAFSSANFTTSIEISDKLGRAHDILLFFTRVASNRWALNVGAQAAEAGDALARIAPSRVLRFDAQGKVRAGRRTRARATFTEAGRQQINLDLSGLTQKLGPSGLSGLQVSGCLR